MRIPVVFEVNFALWGMIVCAAMLTGRFFAVF